MTISVYQKGDLVRITGAFTDVAGSAIDPTTVSLFVSNPAGGATEYVYLTDAAVVKDSVGNYHADISATIAGDWRWWWEATGTGQAVQIGQYVVEPLPL